MNEQALEELTFSKSWTVDQINRMKTRYAALLDLLLVGVHVKRWRGLVHGSLCLSAARQGLVTSGKVPIPTERGLRWREQYTGAVATPDELRSMSPKKKRAQMEDVARRQRSQKPLTVARDLVAAGLLFIHPTVLDKLGPECFYLWAYSRTHRDLTTLEALASALHWGYEETRIRVERCAERGYPLALAGNEDAA